MTVALNHGPLGLEAKHIWTPGDGSAVLTMNDRQAATQVRFKRMPGFRAKAPSDNNREPRTGRHGSNPLPSLARNKSFTVEGQLIAPTLAALRALEFTVQAALGDPDAEGTWAAVPHVDYGSITEYWEMLARCTAFDPDEEFVFEPTHTRGVYQLGFQASFEMSDPRWLWSDPASEIGVASVVATNLGNAPAEPTVTIDNPGAAVTIANTTLGKQLVFLGMGAPSADLVVDFAAGTATFGVDGPDAMRFVDEYESNWMDRGVAGLKASAANTVTQTGGAGLTVAWQHAAW